MTTRPSPSLVRHLFQKEELILRGERWPTETRDVIARYGAPIGSVIHHHEVLERGMDEARRIIERHERESRAFPSGTVIAAERLTAGKGRFRRQWHAPPGGLWLTLVVVNTLLPESSRLYPLMVGVACCELLRQYGIDCHIKWINDVLAKGKKICGILVETARGSRSGEEYHLIGIGINVNNTAFPEELAPLAVSMKDCLGGPVDRHLFAARLLARLAWYDGLLHFVENSHLMSDCGGGESSLEPGGGHPVIHRWRELSDTIGRKVVYGFNVKDAPQYTAHVVDITEEGGLLLRPVGHDAIVTEWSGEVEYA